MLNRISLWLLVHLSLIHDPRSALAVLLMLILLAGIKVKENVEVILAFSSY